MPEYIVEWSINIEAEDPISAALRAERFQKHGHYRGAFGVFDETGVKTLVDLHELEGEGELDKYSQDS